MCYCAESHTVKLKKRLSEVVHEILFITAVGGCWDTKTSSVGECSQVSCWSIRLQATVKENSAHLVTVSIPYSVMHIG